MASPEALNAIVAELQRRGLTLPADLLRGCELMRSFSPDRVLDSSPPASLLALSEEQIWEHINRRALLSAAYGELSATGFRVAQQLATEIAAILLASLDDVLDHVRPAFDATGLAVHQATQVGIRPTMGADTVVALGDAAVAAWRTLPEQVRILDDIAQLRMRFTDGLGADPLPDPYDAGGRVAYAACFAPGGMRWSIGHETSQSRWLRLATPEPVRLLTVAETRQLAGQTRTLPAPFEMVDDEDGVMRSPAYGGADTRSRSAASTSPPAQSTSARCWIRDRWMERGPSFGPHDLSSATELLSTRPTSARSPFMSPSAADDHELQYRDALTAVRALVADERVAVETIARHADSAGTLLSDIAGISVYLLTANVAEPLQVIDDLFDQVPVTVLERWLRRGPVDGEVPPGR